MRMGDLGFVYHMIEQKKVALRTKLRKYNQLTVW